MGLFSSEPVKPRAGDIFDTLCAQLETLMAYEDGERDLLIMQQKFVVEWKDGSEVRLLLLTIFKFRCSFGLIVMLIANPDEHTRRVRIPRWSLRHGTSGRCSVWRRHTTCP